MSKWTPREDAILRDCHGSQTLVEIAEMLGRTRASVRARITRIGIAKINRWTEEERNFVRATYKESGGTQKVDLVALAESLNRGRSEVCAEARRLGLTNQKRMKTECGPKDRRKFKGDEAALKAHLSVCAKERLAENGHPRGMAGKQHTPETLQKMSKISAARWRGMSSKERQELLDKAYAKRKEAGFSPPKGGRGTWRAGWRTVGSSECYFRSRWEANYARYLEWLKSRGEILRWAYEPETFWFDAIKRGVRSYKPDFRVWELDGSSVLHEVKGWMDSRSRTTLRRMKKYHPEETIILIDGPRYRAIRLKVMPLIPDWEDSKRDSHA